MEELKDALAKTDIGEDEINGMLHRFAKGIVERTLDAMVPTVAEIRAAITVGKAPRSDYKKGFKHGAFSGAVWLRDIVLNNVENIKK
jgi:hypothetical protein